MIRKIGKINIKENRSIYINLNNDKEKNYRQVEKIERELRRMN